MEHQKAIDQPLLDDLAPKAEELVTRHLKQRSEWLPHEFIPWSHARDYPSADTYVWQETDLELPSEVRSALYVNLLTEDNLPFYVRDIDSFAGQNGIWREWTGIWTAEEGRHGYAMRAYIEATRALDPVNLERAREAQVRGQQVPPVQSTADGLVYVSLQELATRVAHLNTAKMLRSTPEQEVRAEHKVVTELGYACLKRIATDENHHHLFYRDLVSAAIEIDPSKIVIAASNQIKDFKMPGLGIPGFDAHAKKIAAAGIYGLEQFYYNVAEPVITKQWKLDTLTDLTPQAAEAQDALMDRLFKYKKIVDRLIEKAAKNALAIVEA